MNQIRPLAMEDIPVVAEMYQRLFLNGTASRRNLSHDKIANHFENIFFHNPWRDEEITPLVSQEKSGKINGFLGVVPRQMTFRGQPIRVAVSFYHMADPESRTPFAGVQLAKKFFSGPQDLSLTDGAGEVGRRVWVGVGGMQIPLYSLQWERFFRPARFGVEMLCRRRVFSSIETLLSPVANLADNITTRLIPGSSPKADPEYREEELDLGLLIERLPGFYRADSLLPAYPGQSLQWIVDLAAGLKSHGTLKKVMLRNTAGEVVGWFMYYAKPGSRCPVLHIAAKKGMFEIVMNHMFHHAFRHGVTALFGWATPNHLQEISNQRTILRLGAWLLIHSRNDELVRVFQQGDAALSRLDGEWFLHF